jgi:uncharacterized protein (DUF433 family)
MDLYDNKQASRIRREANEMDTKQKATWRRHIVSTPDVLSGKPRIDGTRIPVALILGYLAADKTYEEVMAEFPDLTRQDIAACLDYARDLADYHVV